MKTLTISLIAIGACYTLFIKMPLQAATFDDVRAVEYSSQDSPAGYMTGILTNEDVDEQ